MSTAHDPDTLLLEPGETMPNSRLPVVIYRAVLTATVDRDGDFQRLFDANGWRGIWRNGVYDYDHYHSNAHEVLGVERGSADLQLGGAGGRQVHIEAGDVVVLPAGTGHRRIDRSSDFVVIGAYPPGQEHYDLCRERSPEAELRISKLALPKSDPVMGLNGPLLELWR